SATASIRAGRPSSTSRRLSSLSAWAASAASTAPFTSSPTRQVTSGRASLRPRPRPSSSPSKWSTTYASSAVSPTSTRRLSPPPSWGQSNGRATDGRENVVSEEDRRPTEGFLSAAAVGAVIYLLRAVVLL